jgi:hypothetical protein
MKHRRGGGGLGMAFYLGVGPVPCQDVADVVWPGCAARVARRKGTRRAFEATPRSQRGCNMVFGESMGQEVVDRH